VTGPPGPGYVTTGHRSLDVTERNRDLTRRGTGAFTSGSGPATRPAGPVTLARRGSVGDRVVPAHLACRIAARARAGERNAWPAISAPPAGSADLARERGQEAAAPSRGAIDTAGNSVPRAR
jgi:hypothetical protein